MASWKFQDNQEYRATFYLHESDFVVSTANHEFFGIGILEAIAAGCTPLLPDRLSYPAILQDLTDNPSDYLYDGTVKDLIIKLQKLIEQLVKNL